MTPMTRSFVVGALIGVPVGLIAAALGTIGLVVLLASAAWAAFVPPRFAMLAALLIAAGAVWLVVAGRFAAICAAEPGSCSGPPIAPFVAAAAAIVLIGAVLALVTRRRAPVA